MQYVKVNRLAMAFLVLLVMVAVPAALAQASPPACAVLEGGVAMQSQPDLLGVWNVDIKRLHRHPTFVIQNIQDKALSGSYTGKLGTFPLIGSYDAATGSVLLSVDFSQSRVARIRRLANKSLVGQFQGKIEDGKLQGIASMPDVTGIKFKWEATKAP